MDLRYFIYLCGVGDFSQYPFSTIHSKSLSSFGASSKGVSLFLYNNPGLWPGLNISNNRSVFKAFDCLGLTKPLSIPKLVFICYLRFYAAILSNVAGLTTLKKQSQMVFSQYLKWQLTCKSSIDNQTAFCLVLVVKMMKKNLFFLPLSFKRGI